MNRNFAISSLAGMAAGGWLFFGCGGVGVSGLEVSTFRLDFGRVQILEARTEAVRLENRGEERMVVMTSLLEPPFAGPYGGFVLKPGEERGIPITFRPEAAGRNVGKLEISLGNGDRSFTVFLKGVGTAPEPVLASREPATGEVFAAALPGPHSGASVQNIASNAEPPESENEARLRADERSRQDEESATERATGGETSPSVDEAVDAAAVAENAETGSGEASQQEGEEKPVVSGEKRILLEREYVSLFGMLVPEQPAFADLLPSQEPEEKREEFHRLPDRQTRPEFPESTKEDTGDRAEETAAGEAAEEEEEEGVAPEPEGSEEEEVLPQPTMVIAGNSTVNLLGSEGSFPFQQLRVRWSENGTNFLLEDRIRYPRLHFAFGQYVDLEQWGEAVGTYDPSSGQVQLPLTIRLANSKGDVLDLPVELTTDWAFGFNSSGAGMAIRGVPRDGPTGDLKVVGIKNIPLEPDTTFKREPLVVELLGMLAVP